MKLSFGSVDLGRYAPGFDGEIAGRWISHEIPGLAGALQEDLGDGRYGLRVPLQFAGPRAQRDYNQVMQALQAAGRRGTLLVPLRGARSSILRSIRESMRYTTQGNAILVELAFEDASLAQPFDFRGGPQAQAGEARAQADAADQKIAAQKDRVFKVYKLNLQLRQRAVDAQAAVGDFTAQLRGYVNAALSVGSTAIFLANTAVNTGSAVALQGVSLVRQAGGFAAGAVATYQEAQAKLRALPGSYEKAAAAVRAIGTGAATGQPTIASLEQALHAAAQLDQALRLAQPIPIESVVTRQPGQTLYAFVAEKYAGSPLTPPQLRALVRAILQLNRLRTPGFLPSGTRILRPAA